MYMHKLLNKLKFLCCFLCVLLSMGTSTAVLVGCQSSGEGGEAEGIDDGVVDTSKLDTESQVETDTGEDGIADGGDGEDGEDAGPPPDLEGLVYGASPGVLRRLTAEQYRNVIRDVFGGDIVLPGRLEPDTRAGGFLALGVGQAAVSARGVELYESGAFGVAEQVVGGEGLGEILTCVPGGVGDEVCFGEVLGRLGRRLWRRPLDGGELGVLVGLAVEAAGVLGSFEEGLVFGVAALLESPHFLYRAEVGEEGEEVGQEKRRLTDWELASRLSFLLWNSGPDEELLDAVERGELGTREGLLVQAERMLGEEKARGGVRAFFSDLYELDRLDGLIKAPELFPHMGEDVGPSAREETLSVIENLVFDARGDWRDIMTTRTTFLNRKLAAIYNVRAPAREGFARTELPEDVPRRGLLGHTSILALYAHPVSTSATLRGVFIRNKLLCQPVPAPPAGVDTSIPEPTGLEPTLRDRLKVHLETPYCASCHSFTDPIGLGLEQFDGIGRYRTKDNQTLIDASGDLDGRGFDGPLGLYGAISEHSQFGLCLTQKLYQYATGHELVEGSQAMTDGIAAHFVANGYDVQHLILTLVGSPGFREVTTHEESTP